MKRSSFSLMRSPVVWGTVLSVLFYAPMHFGIITNATMNRYFAGHAMAYVETTCFFIGLCFLWTKRSDVLRQIGLLEEPLLPVAHQHGHSLDDVPSMLALVQNKTQSQGDCYPRRICESLHAIVRRGNTDNLDHELKHLAHLDAAHMTESYGFIKNITWAIPLLGLMGTAIGITDTFLSQQGDKTMPQMMQGIGMAFDTSAIAMGFSMLLMFLQQSIKTREGQLLEMVETSAKSELHQCFPQRLAIDDPLQTAVQRMLDAIVPTYDRLLKRQIELWQATVDEAHDHWIQLSSSVATQLENAINAAVDKGMALHVEKMAAISEQHDEQQTKNFGGMQHSLDRVGDKMTKQLVEIMRQSEVFSRVIDGNEQVVRLEENLRHNLQALAGTQQLQETLVSLSATLQLLVARINALPAQEAPVIVEIPRGKKSRGQAA